MAFTYYVSTGGSDLASGLTELLAWQHIDKAMNVVAAGDKVYVKADGDYAELATIDTAGTATAPIIFEGYTTTPGDGGQATITGSSSRANCVVDSRGANTDVFYVFKNLRFTAATGAGFLTDCDHITFKNCKFDTNGTYGLLGQIMLCEVCVFLNNTPGVQVEVGDAIFVGCRFEGNTIGIVSQSGSLVLVGCIFFSNSTTNIEGGNYTTVDHLLAVINCTIDGDSKDSNTGILVYSPRGMAAVVNTVLYDCVTGVIGDGGNAGEAVISRNNLVNANTADYSNFATYTGEVTSAPAFVDEAGGADYHPAVGSPLRDAGFDGGASMDIGAVQSVAGAAKNVFKLRVGV